MPVRAPTLEAARRAASELTAAGVGRVLLFGSLTRGEDQAGDIDLVAIYDDLGDYSDRRRLRAELSRRAQAATGCSVDILVTDAAEWAVRTQRVPCSLEASIDGDAVLLADSGPHSVIDWSKEIELPDNALAEVQVRHHDMTVALSRLADSLAVGGNELDAINDRDAEAFISAEEWRFAAACSQAHLVLECGAKTMIALLNDVAPPRTHNLDPLIDELPDCERSQWSELTVDIDTADFHLWRQGGTYTADLPVDGFDESYLIAVATAAVEIASHVQRRCAEAGISAIELRLGRRSAQRVRTALDSDLRIDPDHPMRSGT